MDKKSRAQSVITWNSRNIDGIKNALGGMLSYSLQIAGFAYVLVKLNAVIILFLIGVIIINMLLNNTKEKLPRKTNDELTPVNRKLSYLHKLDEDYAFGQMIRIYNFASLITKKYIENRKVYRKKQEKIQTYELVSGIILSLLGIAQEGLVYVFLVSKAAAGDITLGDLAMYIAATMAFSNAVNNIIGFSIGLNYTTGYVNDFIDFINTPDSMRKTGTAKTGKDIAAVEFKNVSFKYPHAENFALRDVNVSFNTNDRIVLAGDNGAGKTTFIKLLMRLYDPSSGEILLNGRDIKDYDYEDYFTVFSTVFQDYQVFAFTIAENVAFAGGEGGALEQNRAKILGVLEKAGMLAKVNSLPAGLETYLGKSFEDEGVELSGGETQKIAIARSVYKDAPVVIMDEPAANLSPAAEHGLFKHMNDSTAGKTALFVSHRLTSTAFSTRILVFENGTIAEEGTHRELMARNGLYRKLFDMQAAYYLDGGAE